MTIETHLKSLLVNHGLFEDMAERVIAAIKADPANDVMADRWSDESDGYQPQVMAVMWLVAKREALKLIDAECPKHWARSIFAN